MKILAIDGGGIRGYYAAHIIKRIQESFGINFSEEFDLITGTSTGSIIAAALALDIPIARICTLYEKHSRKIFKPTSFSFGGLLRAHYSQKSLHSLLHKEFGDNTLSDTKTRLLIPSTDIGNGQVHVFKSSYSDEFTRDSNIRIADAVLASCAAPKYFDPAFVDPYLLADGGLWANNPSLVAVTEAMTRLSSSLDSIQLLSIGTGIGNNYYPVNKRNNMWGFLTGWGIKSFIEMLLNLQSANAHNTVGLLLNEDQLIRINFESDRALPLDDPSMLADLKSRADCDFTKASDRIKQLLRNSDEA